MKDLDIVYCTKCKFCICEIINKDSELYYCKKHKNFSFDATLRRDKKCFTKSSKK